jgi:Kef-type K+ transport system membrane component KefB/nucleotide-binding universal stress UspA family protein
VQDALLPLPGHAILILLLQLAGLLVVARTLAELMRRLGQPAVIGELCAGLILGPTVLGHFAPGLFTLAFPQETAQFQLLEAISWLGMILLLLLTGLETDVRAMRHLGRAAMMASVFGMVVPFGSGFALGWLLPDPYLTHPENRPIFAAFLATAMAISAMPVIAKILMDLDLIRRNVGLVILSAAVVDDTVGWLVLSVIAGIAVGGAFDPIDLGLTLVWLCVFLGATRWIAYPLLGRMIRYVNERVDLPGADVTLILGFTFLAAAITEAIGIHAVFGAFVAGLVVRQLPRVRSSSLRLLELFVLAALSPIFFAFVGLRVDLWALSGWQLPAVVIAVAVAGKLVGCYVGGRLGRMTHWESLAIGFGMNARGAMGLIVAIMGLSLGLLTQEMYSTIVLMAVVTSLMPPLQLRRIIRHIPLRDDERLRFERAGRVTLLPAGPLRILVPTAGGPNAMAAFRLAGPLARAADGEVTALYVDSTATPAVWRPSARRRLKLAGTNLDAHLRGAAALADENHFTVRRVTGTDVAQTVLHEATRDYDLVCLGAAPYRPLHDSLVQRVINQTPVTVLIVRHLGEHRVQSFRRILVPMGGSVFSRYAVEVALLYGGVTGAEVHVLHVVSDTHRTTPMAVGEAAEGRPFSQGRARELETEIKREIASLAAAHDATMSVRVLTSGASSETIIGESWSGYYDLLIMGTQNKLLGSAPFIAQSTADIVERVGCTTVVVLPKLSQLSVAR